MYFPSFSKPKKNGLMQLDTCWGHLRVINIEREEVQAFSTVRRVDESDEEFAGRAISYATGEREPPVYVLECECGATVRVLASRVSGVGAYAAVRVCHSDRNRLMAFTTPEISA